MSRIVSSAFLDAINASDTTEAFIVLLELDHESLATPIRVVGYDVDVVSNGNTYLAFPFELTLPDDVPSKAPRAKLVIDNVNQSIIQTLRGISTPPSIVIKIVLESDPDTVEVEFNGFSLSHITYDAITIEGSLTLDYLTQEPYPARSFTPSDFRGLFQ